MSNQLARSVALDPAPGTDTHPALDLANSIATLPGGERFDALAKPELATAWLVERNLAGEDAQLYEICTNRLVGLRANIRTLFTAITTSSPPDPATLEAVNQALQLTPMADQLRWNPDKGFFSEPQHPLTQVVEHAMVTLALDALHLATSDDPHTLAACSAQPCDRFFLRTHARRTWCSTRCGNRVRASRLRRAKQSA